MRPVLTGASRSFDGAQIAGDGIRPTLRLPVCGEMFLTWYLTVLSLMSNALAIAHGLYSHESAVA